MSSNDEFIDYWHSVALLFTAVHPLRSQTVFCNEIDAARTEICRLLQFIHDSLPSGMSERDAYHIVFSLTALCDEIAQNHLEKVQKVFSWEPLQFQLYNINDAGDTFFRNIDFFRGRNDVSQLVYRTYLLCLNDGFKGRYVMDERSIASYRSELEAYIEKKQTTAQSITVYKKTRSWPKIPALAYYFTALVLLVFLHYLLALIPLNVVLPE